MNSKLYKQADSRWGSKPYPSGSTMSGCGCGCVACTHVVIEQEKYKNYTPENLRPWMVSQGFAIRGQGTTWNGITKTLQHYGYKVTHIGVNDPMSKAWTELDKGNRIGVILFKGGKAPNGTVWTASGHYVAFTDYKKQNGLHYFYTKDSGGRNHDSAKYGYYSYEKSMKGLVYQMWIVQRVGAEVKTTSTTTATKTTTSNSTLAVDGKFGPASVKALQKVLGTTQDGKITGQTSTLKKYHTGFSGGIVYGKGGSACVKALQKMLKLSGPDGQLGPNTIKAFQKYLGMSGPDGYWGPNTSKAVQKWLNIKLNPTPTSTPPKTTTTTPTTTTIPSTSTSTAKSEEIIDVSYVQSKTIDWAKVKAAGIAGAIVRCGYRGYGSGSLNEDSMFMNHVQGAYKAGLKIGIYFFTEAINEAEGREEARFALKMLQKSGVKLTYPIAIDTENINASNPTPRANSGKLSTANRTAAIKGFCDEIKKNGYEPMIYASTSWLNNQLNMSQLPYKVWVAQYNTKVTYSGSYIIWQYTSTAKINGIDGVVDKNHSYYALGNITPVTVTPTPEPTSELTPKPIETSILKKYTGQLPTMSLIKTNAQAIADAIKWSIWIAGDNSFHYGYGKPAHHNGCYFCGTNTLSGGRAKTGVLDYQKSYCCNPFVGAAWAHGGCVPKAMELCQKGTSWDFSKGHGYDASSLFTKLGHPAKSSLKAGDVLCKDTHVALYVGNGKIAEAGSGDDNVRNSTKWNNSIRVTTLTDANYKNFPRVYRFNSSVNTTIALYPGEISERVKLLQKYLNWYFGSQVCSVDGYFGDGTRKYVKAFQTARKITVDGIVGPTTIAEMGKVKK